MALKLFEFLEQIMIDFFEKINPIGENWINRLNFHFAEKTDN